MPRKTGFFRAARAARGTASMRPRPDAAENGETTARWNCSATRFNEAAARCRGKLGGAGTLRVTAMGFNEAAARCRGKRVAHTTAGEMAGASMRPRPDAAENVAVLVDMNGVKKLQ